MVFLVAAGFSATELFASDSLGVVEGVGAADVSVAAVSGAAVSAVVPGPDAVSVSDLGASAFSP